MKGFKSFADTTVLDFEPGVTVVVGPNGSGKSNVVDAIAWVLGAQGPRIVRSQKMDDVIFAGTTDRPALGRAEVSLVIDNSSGILPIDFIEVTISRTLYRNGDSEYGLNGVSCRLLDIQELLSDAGVGQKQHVIIAQGQIDQVLNAQPEDRRRIIEEAAGILKYRKRKERAERRLDATEANMLRLQDLQREVRRQLRPLAKQADAARRHSTVSAELHQLRLHLTGRELESLGCRLEAVKSDHMQLADEEHGIRAELQELDLAVMAAESQLVAFGDDFGEAISRCESLRERCRGLSAFIDERRRGLERDRGTLLAEDVIASLEAEQASLGIQLAAVDVEVASMAPDVDRLSSEEELLTAEHENFTEDKDEFVPDTSGRAAEIRGELTALTIGLERAESELGRLDERLDVIASRDAELMASGEQMSAALSAADQVAASLLNSMEEAQAAAAEAHSAADATDQAERAAQTEANRWGARVEALRLALDDAHSQAGIEKLNDLDGVVGTLADLVDIDSGWELAFEAAAGDAMVAVVVRDVRAARSALRRLAGADARGAVLALGAAPVPVVIPPIGTPLRDRVHAKDADIDALLDRLIGTAVVADGDWTVAVDTALAYPDVVVVTRNGDRCGVAGWRIGAGGSGATAAALQEAADELSAANGAHEAASAEALAANAMLSDATEAQRLADVALERHNVDLSSKRDELDQVGQQRRDVMTEAETRGARRSELTTALDRDRDRVATLDQLLPELEHAEDSVRRTGAELDRVRDSIDQRARAVAALRSDLGIRAAGLEERRTLLLDRLGEVETRLAADFEQRNGASVRRVDLEARLAGVDRLRALVEDRRAVVTVELDRLRDVHKQRSESTRQIADQLDAFRSERTAATKRQDELRELLARQDVQEVELGLRVENLVAVLRQELDADPNQAAMASLPDLENGISPAARVRELTRDLKAMGPVNPLALSEHEALTQRHDFVSTQLDDVREGRRELTKVIRAINTEIVRIFAAAVADVSQNFEKSFTTLFPGGHGRLLLTDTKNLLKTGIEIQARPSGKNVRSLSLLSGGERSLTALAFLFAIFRSRPSPFYVMDEVEAALDDVNLHRFLDLIAEFRRDAQLVVVSHQKRTMEAADYLYGVSMASGGSSRVVSEKLT